MSESRINSSLNLLEKMSDDQLRKSFDGRQLAKLRNGLQQYALSTGPRKFARIRSLELRLMLAAHKEASK